MGLKAISLPGDIVGTRDVSHHPEQNSAKEAVSGAMRTLDPNRKTASVHTKKNKAYIFKPKNNVSFT